MKLLLLEDNVALSTDLKQYLTGEDFIVETATTLRKAIESVTVYSYDLLIIDIGLPDGSGLDLVRDVREKGMECGILILTAKNSLEDKVMGLELGADDYLTKPFHKPELNARIRSILRRKKAQGSNVIESGPIRVDTLARIVYIENEMISLTKKEYDMLLFFLYNQERLLTKESIAEHLWGDHIDQADSFDFIYNHIKNLRRKISQKTRLNVIRSMYGMGYMFSGKGEEK